MKRLTLCLLVYTFSAMAWASESPKFQTSTSKKKLKLNRQVGDIDKEIDSDYLRAKSGSKNRWSSSFNGTYRGGSLNRPFGETRPHIYDDVSSEGRTSVNGDISFRYRATKHDSISLGTGVSLYTPFHGDTDRDESQFDVSDPSLAYSRVYRLGAFQNITTLSGSMATTDGRKSTDYKGSVVLSQNLLSRFGPWTVGAVAGLTHNVYGNTPSRVESWAYPWMVMASPYAEFKFAPKWSARTFLSVMTFYHTKDREGATFFNMDKGRNWTTLGVSYSWTRDIYLYPNILFNPDDIDSERSLVGLTTTINL